MDLSALSDGELLVLLNSTKQKIAMYDNTQQALKILLNGGYGAMSNQHNRWYSDDVAESITMSGQLSARWIIQHVNKFLNRLFGTIDVDYVIAVDTDSMHLNVDAVIERTFGDVKPTHEQMMHVLEKFSKTMDKVIAEGYELLAKELNVYESAMHMKLETICSAIWAGKKHYAMEVWANEGIRYDPPKIKIVGLEAVKSSTPQRIRDWMKELIPMMFTGEAKPIKDYIEAKRQEYFTLPFEQVAKPSSLNGIEKYSDSSTVYSKGAPIHVRGALLYNDLLKREGLDKTLQPISSGDKVRFCYMILPNPLKENVLTCPDQLPAELMYLQEFIDYSKQFDKTFADPMISFAGSGGIRLTSEIDVSQFFI